MAGNNKYKLYIDVGSLATKVYKFQENGLKHLINFSLNLKEGFDPEIGLSDENKQKLIDFLISVKKKHQGAIIKIFATAIFRKINSESKIKFIDEFFIKTGLYFNIIEHDLENFYLEMALIEKCGLTDPVLLINIGGGSTELVVVRNREPIEKYNLDLGVGTINAQFPNINNKFSGVTLEKVTTFVNKKLPQLRHLPKIAFYSGGELTYMKLAKYKITKNTLFSDSDHPYLISLADFRQRNREIFNKVSRSELEKLMPDNPTWMHGARGCSAIAQAICQKYNVTTIIPSGSDLIHGASRQEFRAVTLSGSFRKHLNFILDTKKELERRNVNILSPRFTNPENPGDEFVIFSGEENLTPLELERRHLNSIIQSDALIVCDPDGYVGASTLIEIGFAKSLGKKIIFIEPPQEFILNTLPAEIGL